jgi:hypothetical protein
MLGRVPESEKILQAAGAVPTDADVLVEICTLILHDRLAAENHQVGLAGYHQNPSHL